MQKILQLGFRYIDKKKYIVYLLLSGIGSVLGMIIPLIMGEIINKLTEEQIFSYLLYSISFFFLLNVLQQICGICENYLGTKLGMDSGYKANRDFIKKMYHTSYLNICREDPSMLHQKISNDIGVIVNFSIYFLKNLFGNIIYTIFVFCVLISESLILCVMVFLLAVIYAIVYLLSKKELYTIGYEVKECQTTFFGKLYSMFFYMKSIRNNGFEEISFIKQDKEYKNYYKTLMKQVGINNKFQTMIQMISLFAQIGMFIYGGYMVIHNELSIGMLVVILDYFSVILQSTNYFLNLGKTYQDTRSSYERILPYEDMQKIPKGIVKIEKINQIELKEVAFHYFNQENLFQINQHFEKGNIYWIKGKNGIGKSTLMNLILGLYGKEYSGKICINGMSIEEIDIAYMLENRIAIIEQDPYLLTDSLYNNMICKTKSESKQYKQELKYLLTLFDMDEFINKQDNGLDTIYNSMNTTMSGGEKQKICLIRMLLSEADIWFLDEPSSALDEKSTKRFFEEIELKKKNHIIIMISHEKPLTYDYVVNMMTYIK